MAVAKFLPPPSVLISFVDHLEIDRFAVPSTPILDRFVMAYSLLNHATPIGARRDSFHLHLLQSIECNEYIRRQDFLLAYFKVTTFPVLCDELQVSPRYLICPIV